MAFERPNRAGSLAGLTPAVLALLMAGGCATGPMATAPAPVPMDSRYLLEDFERGHQWSLDSANNYGQVDYSAAHATAGRSALVLTFVDSGRYNTMFRKEVQYDLSEAGRLWLDAFNHAAGEGVACALAFRTKSGGFFETQPVSLAPGRNPDMVFTLDEAGFKPGTDMAAWRASSDRVTRLMVLVWPGANTTGRLTVDNLRVDRGDVDQSFRPDLVARPVMPAMVRQYEPMLLPLRFTIPSLSTNVPEADVPPRDLPRLTVRAHLVRPDGRKVTIRGFLRRSEPAERRVDYEVRFTPYHVGRWRISLGYERERTWVTVLEREFVCWDNPTGPAPIDVDRDDPTYFASRAGGWFYPIGQNVCWAADYEPYFKAIRGYGGNIVRIWVCPWNNPLLQTTNVHNINLESAEAIDGIFTLAEKYGIYVHLVLAYHGWLKEDWSRNPFNLANNGPCALPQDFWVDRKARAAFRRYLDYVAARWSYHPNLFAVELLNEAHFTPRYRDRDIVAWHTEMASYLKRVDPHKRLTTVSITQEGWFDEIWRHQAVDFVNTHLYRARVGRALNKHYVAYRKYHKPYFVAEIGRGWLAHQDQRDPRGHHLHHSLWLAWMTPTAGNCLPWWWDTYIEVNDLYRHFRAVARFGSGEDRRGKHLKAWWLPIQRGNGETVQVQGLIGRDAVFGFVYDPEVVIRPEAAAGPLLMKARDIDIKGLPDGEYTVEFWDTVAGVVTSRRSVACKRGVLRLRLPAAKRDFAFKVKPIEPIPLEVRE
jgi:hypothetical protein